MRLSIAIRKAESVLPEPVGAATSVWRPAWIAGHACACAAVGAPRARANHAATAGWKHWLRIWFGAVNNAAPRNAGEDRLARQIVNGIWRRGLKCYIGRAA